MSLSIHWLSSLLLHVAHLATLVGPLRAISLPINIPLFMRGHQLNKSSFSSIISIPYYPNELYGTSGPDAVMSEKSDRQRRLVSIKSDQLTKALSTVKPDYPTTGSGKPDDVNITTTASSEYRKPQFSSMTDVLKALDIDKSDAVKCNTTSVTETLNINTNIEKNILKIGRGDVPVYIKIHTIEYLSFYPNYTTARPDTLHNSTTHFPADLQNLMNLKPTTIIKFLDSTRRSSVSSVDLDTFKPHINPILNNKSEPAPIVFNIDGGSRSLIFNINSKEQVTTSASRDHCNGSSVTVTAVTTPSLDIITVCVRTSSVSLPNNTRITASLLTLYLCTGSILKSNSSNSIFKNNNTQLVNTSTSDVPLSRNRLNQHQCPVRSRALSTDVAYHIYPILLNRLVADPAPVLNPTPAPSIPMFTVKTFNNTNSPSGTLSLNQNITLNLRNQTIAQGTMLLSFMSPWPYRTAVLDRSSVTEHASNIEDTSAASNDKYITSDIVHYDDDVTSHSSAGTSDNYVLFGGRNSSAISFAINVDRQAAPVALNLSTTADPDTLCIHTTVCPNVYNSTFITAFLTLYICHTEATDFVNNLTSEDSITTQSFPSNSRNTDIGFVNNEELFKFDDYFQTNSAITSTPLKTTSSKILKKRISPFLSIFINDVRTTPVTATDAPVNSHGDVSDFPNIIKSRNYSVAHTLPGGVSLVSNALLISSLKGDPISVRTTYNRQLPSHKLSAIDSTHEPVHINLHNIRPKAESIRVVDLPKSNDSSLEKHSLLIEEMEENRAKVVYTRKLYVAGYMKSHGALCPALGQRLRLVVLVASQPAHREHRDAIRHTWGKYAIRHMVTLAFVLGSPPPDLAVSLHHEDAIHGDLIQGNYVDSYSNLTLKTISMLEWMTTYCPHARFLFKTADDVFVNLPHVLKFTKRLIRRRTVWGRMIRSSRPERSCRSKYRISRRQFPGSVLPEHAAGPAYLVSGDAVESLYVASVAPGQAYVRLEDVYVTGLLAGHQGLHHAHVWHFYSRKLVPHPCAVRRALAVHCSSPQDHFRYWKQMRNDGLICNGVFYSK